VTTIAIIIFVIFLLGVLINAPGVGVAAFILMVLTFIQDGSHGKLPLIDYFMEGAKLFFK
jgi:hypothetical protein